jgi:hypothetical protein
MTAREGSHDRDIRPCRVILPKDGLPVPDDLLACATGGKVSDAQVINWACPLGVHS